MQYESKRGALSHTHTWIHAHTCMHTCMHACIHTCTHTTCIEQNKLS